MTIDSQSRISPYIESPRPGEFDHPDGGLWQKFKSSVRRQLWSRIPEDQFKQWNYRHEYGAMDETNRVNGLVDLIETVKPQTVLEIGSHRGVSTYEFLKRCKWVVAVDPWLDKSVFKDFEARCASLRLTVVTDKSPRALAQFVGHRKFDLCYIDGLHDYVSVCQDIRAAKRVAVHIAGHDIVEKSVWTAVWQELGKPEVFKDGSWLVRDCGGSTVPPATDRKRATSQPNPP